jgi:hypothetical protein
MADTITAKHAADSGHWIGMKFGQWKVIGVGTNRRYLCECSCGNIKSVFIENLKRGLSKSCGCMSHANPAHNYVDLIGKKFGKLTTLERVSPIGVKQTKFRCLCECGNETLVFAAHLKNGHTKSCGCLASTSKHSVTHGKSNTSTYRSWMAMIRRCTNPNCSAYQWYGKKNIMVCDDWKKFDNFLRDMGDRPTGMELDRIDNYSGYSRDNCRWVTHKENCMNRRNNVSK